MMTEFNWMLAGIVVLSGFAVVYHHILFPLYLKRRVAITSADFLPNPPVAGEIFPTISIIIPAYNEATVIASKVRNLASLIYPADKLSIVIICDGCSDDTERQARRAAAEPECRDLQISIIARQKNQGKVAVLNFALKAAKSEIVCLTDASAWMSIDALLQAARHFQKSDIGVVAGSYYLFGKKSNGEDVYWRYQRTIKQGEASLGAPMGVHGACYFMRSKAIHALPDDTINDDFILPMQAVAEGYRAIYEPSILALEMEPSDPQMDFTRRCRIAAGNTQQVFRLAALLHPRHPGIAMAFASGKALRVAMPYLMLLSLIGSAVLAIESALFLGVFLMQFGGYALAAGRASFIPEGRSRLLDVLHYIVIGHTANLVGSVRYLAGLEKGRWSKVSSQRNMEVPR